MTSLRRKVVRVCSLLEKRFGRENKGVNPRGSALDILVATILSQNTSDRNSVPAFRALKRRFPKWELVLGANEKGIAQVIRGAGLANLKAKRIKLVLSELKRRRGKLDLSFLRRMPTREAREFLLSFNGVGPKTTAVVLNFAFGKPVFPVDTHIYRVTRRLGVVSEKTSREKAHDVMDELVPDSEKGSCHVNLILLGRSICRPWNPRCLECPLNSQCGYFHKYFRRSRT